MNILTIVGEKSAVFLSLFICDKAASVKHNKLLWKSFPALILELKIRTEKSIENLDRWDWQIILRFINHIQSHDYFQHQAFHTNAFNQFSAVCHYSELNHQIAILLKWIENLHERSSLGIVHYKSHKSVENMKQLKASTLALIYSWVHFANNSWAFNGNLMTNPWFSKI